MNSIEGKPEVVKYLLVDEDWSHGKVRVWLANAGKTSFIGAFPDWQAVLTLCAKFGLSYRLLRHNRTTSSRSS